ncbi:serine/threonine protein kinase [Planomonospora sp. ID67723]|uniref:serine/threonine-protein kinase n=1 Tax=Planomonospora sp. ID67723 TaxID=2738134 RepID=UPI0018C413B2|nr:serine/threonine-protein kinase [Planomonospora sp. ID67723]MBG0828181.1 serine/threonine protein kinase [Planomonospora sp. ID67723]
MADAPFPVLADRYRAVEKLGEGGMGTVWRARDELLHREVAIKEVRLASHLPAAHRAEMRERTLREARAAARLSHPAIVAVHDVIAQDDRPWIVMDLVRGHSLEQAIRSGGPLPPGRVAAIGAAMLDALALAHSRGIMHRDVKPANIMLSQDGGVLLTDFGIATLEGDAQLTSPDALVGSPGYIAPERLRGTGDGPAADLWSLGATLYAAVEGKGPFHRGTPVATLGAVLTQETPYPGRAGGLAPVLLAMLAKDPRDRPGESALRSALRQVSLGRSAGPLSPAAEPQAAPAPRRRRTGLIAGAGLAVAAAGTAAAVLLTMNGTEPPAVVPTGPDPRAGRFATAPELCSLLTDAQARAVVPGAAASEIPASHQRGLEASCVWDSLDNDPELRVSLTLHGPTPKKTGPEAAHEFFTAEHSKTKSDAGKGVFGSTGPLRDVEGIGDEAFAYDTNVLDDRIHSTVRFRTSNLLVEVGVSMTGKRPTAELRRRALRTAKLVARSLERRG